MICRSTIAALALLVVAQAAHAQMTDSDASSILISPGEEETGKAGASPADTPDAAGDGSTGGAKVRKVADDGKDTGAAIMLFSRLESGAPLDKKSAEIVETIKSLKTTSNVSVFRIASGARLKEAMTRPLAGKESTGRTKLQRLVIPLTSSLKVTATGRIAEVTDRDRVWTGAIKDGDGEAILAYEDDGSVTGTVYVGDKVFSIRPLGNGMHAVVEKKLKDIPGDHPPAGLKPKGPSRSLLDSIPRRRSKEASGKKSEPVVVDLLVAYTEMAAKPYRDVVKDLIKPAIRVTNLTFSNSGLKTFKVRLVHTHKVDVDEDKIAASTRANDVGKSDGKRLMDRMVSVGDGSMDELHRLRDKYGADVVVLVVGKLTYRFRGRTSSYCGEADGILASERNAFAVVSNDCAVDNLSFPHELGHLFGARHDPAVDDSPVPFAYGHGFVHSHKWRTVMAYARACGGKGPCRRLPRFSNPGKKVDGVATGTKKGHFNAAVLYRTLPWIAKFKRETAGGAGAVADAK